MKKRILPVLLALALVMSMIPMAFATITPDTGKCQCTNESCEHTGASGGTACGESPVNGDTKCATCGGVEKFKCTCAGECLADGGSASNHVANHSDGFTLSASGLCSACKAAKDALDEAEAAKKCNKGGCTKDKGHETTGATDEEKKHNGTSCSGDAFCPIAAEGTHVAGCTMYIPACTGEANCPRPADKHENSGTDEAPVYACKSMCTMSSTCKSTAHKANCVMLCTFVADDAEHTGANCPNTSGDPTVHKAGCAKATVSDSVVLNPTETTSPEPTESVDPSEEPTTPVEITKAEDFSDVNADDWFAPELTTVIEKGWLKGNEDGSFNPEGNVSGQEAVVFVSRMLGKDLVTTGENWADAATAWAAEDGLTEGIEITSEGIARKDLILLLWRAAGKQSSDHEISFSDVDELEGDYLTALKWAVENKIIQGNDDGTAAPNAATSRSEVAAMLFRYDKAVNK